MEFFQIISWILIFFSFFSFLFLYSFFQALLLSKTVCFFFMLLFHLSCAFFLVFNFWWCCRRVFDIPDILRVYIFYFFVPGSIFVTEFFIFSFENFRNFFLPSSFFFFDISRKYLSFIHLLVYNLFNVFLMFQILEFSFNCPISEFIFTFIDEIILFHSIKNSIYCFIFSLKSFKNSITNS